MKSSLSLNGRMRWSLLVAACLLFGRCLLAQDLTVSGNLSATGTLDIDGNQASFGTQGSNAGYFLSYTAGNPATVNLTATSAGANWIWSEGAGGTLKTQLKLSNTNTLSLFNPSTGVASIFLNPAGASNFVGGITVNGVSVLTTTGNGSGLTGLSASQLTTGTLSAALLPSTVVQTTTAQTLTNKTLDGTTLTGTTVLGGGTPAQQVVVDASGNVGIGTMSPTAKLQVAGDGYALFGPNSSWGQSLRIGGNGNPTNNASVVVTDGNLHLDAEASHAIYLNYYRGAGGVNFGNAASGIVGSVSAAGALSMNGTGTFLGNVGIGDVPFALSPAWKGAEVIGQSGFDKVVVGPLVSSYTGATIGSHNTSLTVWSDLNIVGANLIFRTNGEAEVARLTSSGNLGIGTLTPAAKLDVAGDVNVQGNLNVTGTLTAPNGTVAGGSTGLVVNAGGTDQNITLSPSGTGQTITAAPVAITSTAASTSATTGALTVAGGIGVGGSLNVAGNVGIGTLTPDTKLQVKGGAFQEISGADNWSGMYLDAPATNEPKVGFRVSDNSERFRIHFQGVNTSTERLAFIKTMAGEAEVMSVLANGNVGIGAIPSSKLTVAPTATQDGITIETAGALQPMLLFKDTIANTTGGLRLAGGGSDLLQIGSGVAGTIPLSAVQIGTDIYGAPLNAYIDVNTSRVAILNGNVGIGTSSPTAKLEVADTSGANPTVRLSSTGGGNPQLFFNRGGSATDEKLWDFIAGNSATFSGRAINDSNSAASDWIDVTRSGASISKVSFPNGNVGIGTATPAAKLDVAGDVNVQGNLTVTGNSVSLPNQTLSGGTSILTQGLADGLYMKTTGGNASGSSSIAMTGGVASGDFSTAMTGGHAEGNYSTAMSSSYAHADYSVSMCNGDAYGVGSVAMTGGNTLGYYSTAMGYANAYGAYSVAFSMGIANGDYSTAIGPGTETYAPGQVIVGYGNQNTGDQEDLFVVGNGEFYPNYGQPTSGVHSNAFIVKKNGNMWVAGDSTLTGNVGIGTSTPAEKLDVAGNIKATGTVTAGKIRVPQSGDLSMGTFTTTPTGLPSL